MTKYCQRQTKFKFIKQRDAMQCGVASLAMLCSCYGRMIDVSTLEHICVPSNQGVSLKGLIDASEAIGLKAVPVRAGVDELRGELPAILHWNQNHFVVLLSANKALTKFKIADPAKGVIRLSRQEFEKGWISSEVEGKRKGIAMLCEPTDEFFVALKEEEAQRSISPRKSPMRFLTKYLNGYKRHFAIVALTLLFAALFQLIFPFLTQAVVDRGIAHSDISLVWLILLGELFIVLGRTITDFLRSRLLLRISMNVSVSLISDFLTKLMRLPMSFFDSKLLGDLLQRIDDHRRVESFLTGQALSVLFAAISFIVFSIVLLIYDPAVFAVFIGGSVLYGLWKSLFLKRRKVLDYEMFEQQAINSNKTYQLLTSMQEIKLQDCERRRRCEWEDVQKGLFGIQMKTLKLDQTQQSGAIFINEVKNIVIIALCATAVINGQISLGAMLAIQFIIGQLTSPVDSLIGLLYTLQDIRISLDRINEIHERAHEDTQQIGHKLPETEDCKNAISLRNVNFRYDKHNPLKILDSVSFDIPKGKVTAIVGASGSGKTTLLKLMLGFYPVEGGSLEIYGRNIEGLNKKQLRRKCGVVMQEGVIFSDSIERNIATSDREANKEHVCEAARAACLHDTVMQMPLKYNTKIGKDGIGLSLGQKQRVLIARA
ncbi:MAG: peptidase domain-containing ABC transporter, partial [Muribaculum sp.]|nr:peptidase domain-containing ABC transporter [Muribaculum sp.]